MKIYGYLAIAFAYVLSIWLFFWPLVECIYAVSWNPLVSDPFKMMLFLFGGCVFIIGTILGIKIAL